MKKPNLIPILFSILLLSACSTGPTFEFTLDTSATGAQVQPTMYGVFFEDINFAADGGLYGELVKNRSFEFPDAFAGWTVYGNVSLRNDGPFPRNPHYVHLGWSGHSDKFSGLENSGFFGMGIKQGASYAFSVYARGNGLLRVALVDDDTMEESQVFAEDTLRICGSSWEKKALTLTSPRTICDGHLRITLSGEGSVDLEHVSLFPVDSWNGILRADLVKALEDLRPGVFRFPGGCIVEGADLATRYQWKNSVGPAENRPLNENRWHYTFYDRLYPDYFQSYGLGFYEYFLLSEHLGAEPLPVVSCGLACQYQNWEKPEAHVPVKDLGPYIQDALDLVEFANGDTGTRWGALRAEMGHPEPFNLKYLAVGNEQWGPLYTERLEPFVAALREKCPEILIVGTSGPGSEGEQFDYLWPEMRRLGADLVDEHFYRPEKWFLEQGNRYDSYDRNGPKVFAGEYACHGADGHKFNHFNAALMEAAFMTGMERNADVVYMATPAPLFAHEAGWQWRPDLIWFDNLDVVRTCSYYVQQLYSLNKGTVTVPLTMDGRPVAGNEGQAGLFASGVFDSSTSEYIIKIANTADSPFAVSILFDGLSGTLSEGVSYTLHCDEPYMDNTLEEPDAVVPEESKIVPSKGRLKVKVGARTFAVYRIPVK